MLYFMFSNSSVVLAQSFIVIHYLNYRRIRFGRRLNRLIEEELVQSFCKETSFGKSAIGFIVKALSLTKKVIFERECLTIFRQVKNTGSGMPFSDENEL